jgi:hypothetical protein
MKYPHLNGTLDHFAIYGHSMDIAEIAPFAAQATK